ncbi:sensor histidine kinase [Planctomycetota bacterium]
MTRIIEKRQSLHKQLAGQEQKTKDLESEINGLQGPANIGIVTCMIAHEINNILTPLANYAALALSNPDDEALAEKALHKTELNCRRAIQIMESMLSIANGQKQEKENCNLATLLEEVFNCLCRDFSKDKIKVNIRIPEDLVIFAVPVQIQQVLMNLIMNAREAMMPKGGTLTIQACEKADYVRIEVEDTGPGIASEGIERVFEPFYSTKSQQKSNDEISGSGFGLAFCKRIIEKHEGTIKVDSVLEKGTTFTITLSKPKQN